MLTRAELREMFSPADGIISPAPTLLDLPVITVMDFMRGHGAGDTTTCNDHNDENERLF